MKRFDLGRALERGGWGLLRQAGATRSFCAGFVVVVAGAHGSFPAAAAGLDAWSPHQLSASADGTLLGQAGPGKRVRIWDVGARNLLQTLETEMPIKSVALSGDGAYLVGGSHGEDGFECDPFPQGN